MTAADDAVGYFLEDMAYHGKSDRTVEAYRRVLRDFEGHLEGPPAGATQRDCLAWIHALREDAAESTVATYAAYLHRFYAYMTQAGEFDANPMTLVMEELDESIDRDPTRRDLSVARMREFIQGVTHPLDRAVVLTLLKTGIRAGELANLDRRDLAVEGAGDVRAEIESRERTLYVPADIDVGDSVAGERRSAANKRKRDTLIPVDDELTTALRRWLAVRPDPRSEADPLFVSTRDRWGERLTPSMTRNIVTRHASAAGWHHDGAGGGNVTPHYFRHFFTTHLRDRTGDRGVVKYLRGDVADDIIDTYTHNWGDRVRHTYEANVYSLL